MSTPAIGTPGEVTAPGEAEATARVRALQALIARTEGVSEKTSAPSATAGAEPATGTSFASALQTATASAAGGASQYDTLIQRAAARNGVDPAVLHGLIQQESGFNASSQSSAGAMGLTQLMPGTASSLGVSNPLDPAESIEGGARYLAQMLSRFGGNSADALAAYNAGPGAVQQYGGVPPYAETQSYVQKVLGYAESYRREHPAAVGGIA